MASLKETPRQKMIGMMYLVLTALLALQVSDALLQKFALLNSSLEMANQSFLNKSKGMVQGIEERIKGLPNPAAYADVLRKANDVRRNTDALIGHIEDIKGKVLDAAGGIDPATGNIKNPKEEEKIGQLMVGSEKSKNGEAYKLIPMLDKYVKDLLISADPGTKFEPLAKNGLENPIAKNDPDLSKLDFAELNFSHTPVAAALATLSQFQSEIRRYEAEVLNQLAGKVGAKEIKFDKVFAQVSANANTVVAGMEYEAEVFIGATSSGFTPRMSLNGASIQVVDGRGKIKFKTSGGAFDGNGLAKKTYTASVSYMSPTGPKTETITKEYFVLKPTYNIESGTLPPLYLGCANRISVVSPGLGALWNPSFSSEGGEVIAGSMKGKVTIVPSSASVTLNVNNGGTLIGKEVFRVGPVPKPTVKILVNGGDNKASGYSYSSVRLIEARAIPDEAFKLSNPQDANYRVTKFKVVLARGSRPVGKLEFNGPSGSIQSLVNQAQPNDRYIVTVQEVSRRNFKGEIDKMQIEVEDKIALNP